ncbi:hypothetical protein [Taibaiella soli]|uniref:Uncharacterized protein n=1 Tax=Taibaiella soli TaxID=1649169 RepID=A0A2W2AAF2_9BACT|nr:hypothetical protein [Taibaiella soli]PZF72375.1 hypothetical protein DN068_13555 [Taibaiella soli]
MKLYPRKLHTVGELKKEKQRLLKQRRALDKEDLLSFDDVLGSVGSGIGSIFRKKKKKKKDGSYQEGNDNASIDYIALASDLLTSGFGVNTLIDVGLPLFTKFSPQIKKGAFKVSKEVLGGYVKWKAVELGYRFVRSMLSKHKAKNAKQKARGN